MVLIEHAGVEKLILHVVAVAPVVRLQQVGVGKDQLGIFVEILHVGASRSIVKVKVLLLDVFAVVAFAVGQSEESLPKDWVPSVPEG